MSSEIPTLENTRDAIIDDTQDLPRRSSSDDCDDDLNISRISAEISAASAAFSGKHDGSVLTAKCSGLTLRTSGGTAAERLSGQRSIATKLVEITTMSREVRQRLSELTINKLKTKFSDDALVGREKEMEMLKKSLNRLLDADQLSKEQWNSVYKKGSKVSSDVKRKESSLPCLVLSKVKKELVYVRGDSGTGKSRLAQTIQKHVATNGGVFVEGKFDMLQKQPYSAVVEIFGRICRYITGLPADTIVDVSREMEGVLGKELFTLADLIPELKRILFRYDAVQARRNSLDEFGLSVTANPNKFKEAFRVLTRVLCSAVPLIIMVFDDLQWADAFSLELIDHLITDFQNSHRLMIVGCYRSNEAPAQRRMAGMIYQRTQSSRNKCFNLTEVEVCNFTVVQTRNALMHIMSVDDHNTIEDLAQLCHNRTLGNPYFIVEFLKMLYEQNFLEYNLITLKWSWDVPRIRESTMSTANVVEVLLARMRNVDPKVQLLLRCAACLGFTFRDSTLRTLWNDLTHSTKNPSEVMSIDDHSYEVYLNAAVENMMIEAFGDNEYIWSHDKIKEAALLLGDEDIGAFQNRCGAILLEQMDVMRLDEELFCVADLANRGTQRIPNTQVAGLNLRAAQRARKFSAFDAAAKYVDEGIARLPDDKWNEPHKYLSLQLYTIGAQMKLIVGDAEAAAMYSREILRQSSFTTMETLPVKMTEATTLCTVQLRYDDCIDYCVSALKQLGCNLFWNRSLISVQAVAKLFRTIKRAKRVSEPSFKDMKRTEDTRQLAISHLVARVGYASYLSGNILTNMLCTCKQVELTLENGLSDYSAVALTNLANFSFAIFDDYETAGYFSDMSLVLKDMVSESYASEYLFVTYNFFRPWNRPFQESLKQFADGYRIGMRIGQIAVALYSSAIKTRKRKYLKEAQKIRKFLQSSAVKGNPNLQYYLLFLKAEQATYDKRFREARKDYETAIKIAAKTGHLHHAGLFNERFADFHLNLQHNKAEAKYRLQEAIRFYFDWGAAHKVEKLGGRILAL